MVCLTGLCTLMGWSMTVRAHFVISAVVRSLRSCRSTVTAADLKMPPPPLIIFTPWPKAVLSPGTSCTIRIIMLGPVKGL